MLTLLKKNNLYTRYKSKFQNRFCHKGSQIYDAPKEEGKVAEFWPIFWHTVADGFWVKERGEVSDSCRRPHVQ